MTIKHLILCGGGPSIFRSIGALYYLEDSKFWQIDNIETIFATSAGAIFGAILCLGFDHETIINYLVNRPWHEAFPIKVSQIMDIYSKKGLYDHKVAEIIFKPLLNAKDLPLTITMKELYEYSKIELHMYSLEINDFQIEDISYKTHPDLPLLDALIMTSAIPTIFVPFCKGNKCYVDGGIVANYPLNFCLDQGHKKDEILGIRFIYKNNILDNDTEDNTPLNKKKEETMDINMSTSNHISNGKHDLINDSLNTSKDDSKPDFIDKSIINQSSNVLEFVMGIFGKLIRQIGTEFKQEIIPYELRCDTSHMSFYTFKTALFSSTHRKQMIENGAKFGKEFVDVINLAAITTTNATTANATTIL